nr:47 kDa selenoprotein [Peptoclostridium acidaminophilum]
MKKLKVVHYINNFFAGVGGEEKANIPPEMREGAVGPGMALAAALGDEAEVVATVICGDSYYGENMDSARKEILEMIKDAQPDAFVAGPAFNAGRYGVACGSIAKAVEEDLGIPSVTGMYVENPGVDMYRKDIQIIETGNSAADLRNSMPKLAKLVMKKAKGELVGPPEVEGYHMMGIRTNFFHEKRGSERAIDMLVNKLNGEKFETEYPMPVFDRVPPNPAVKDMSKVKVAIVTSGGIVPHDNPDRIESSSATRYGIYDITGMDSMSADDFTSIHGGYDRAFVVKDPNLVVPLDVMRDLEREGVIGELANYFVSTTGTGTSVGNAKGFGESFSKKLIEDGVGAVILTST